MILPFTTNQWNALRFVAVSIVCVPILEKALHRLHQLRAAHRLLSSKPTRIRSSNLGNWGLHQEVDELNYRSKLSSILVAVLYLGFSLYTEYASGSRQVPRTRIWLSPVSTNSSLQGKPKFYDTSLVGAWPDTGCTSKASRMAIHNLSEDIVVHKVQGYLSLPQPGTWREAANETVFANDLSTSLLVRIYDNGTHLLFQVRREEFSFPFLAAMDDEKVCISHSPTSLACYAKSENISVVAVIGNIIHFQYGLFGLRDAGTRVLLSNDAFTIEADDEMQKEAWASVTRARTRTEFLDIRRRNNYINFFVRFKYAASAIGHICKEEPQIEPKILRIPRNPRLVVHEKPRKTSIYLNTTAMCIGLFQRELIMFRETRNSTMVCYEIHGSSICAQNQSDGTIHLMFILQHANYHYIGWTMLFGDKGIRLADLARAAFVSAMISRVVHGTLMASEGAKNILQHFEKGMPKSTQVGVSHSVYTEIIRVEERATMITWVLVLWVLLFFLGLSSLLYSMMVKAQLFPDLDFLYRHAVMQRHTRFNCVKSIRNPPTVSITKTGELVELNISYDNIEPGNTAPGDVMI